MSIFGRRRAVSDEWIKGTSQYYFELELYTFLEGIDTKRISVDIQVNKQTDMEGHGPGYVIAGLTDQNYWYEILVTHHWIPYFHGSDPYFKDDLAYQMELWTPPPRKEYKVQHEHLIGSRSTGIEDGDTVNLSLEIKGDEVISIIQGKEKHEHKWPSYGSGSFIGTGKPANEKGEFMPWKDGVNSWIGIEYYHETPGILGADPGKTTSFTIQEPKVQFMQIVLNEGREIEKGIGEVDIKESFEEVLEGIIFRGDGKTISIGKL